MELLNYTQMFDDPFMYPLFLIMALVIISLIYGLIMQGVDAAKKDVEDDGGNVKGCIQIIGWIFIGLLIYWVINM